MGNVKIKVDIKSWLFDTHKLQIAPIEKGTDLPNSKTEYRALAEKVSFLESIQTTLFSSSLISPSLINQRRKVLHYQSLNHSNA